MSKECYESFIPENEKDIMKIESRPQVISYSNLYNLKDCEKIYKIFTVVPTNTEEGFNKGIAYVLRKIVPEFKDVTEKDISITHFSEGITNKIICATNLKNNFKVIVRTYGAFTEFIIDRDMELIVMNSAPKVKIYGTFLNGLIYSYIEGNVISFEDLKDLKRFNQTILAIVGHHKLTPPIKKVPLLFITLRKWITNVPLEYIEPEKKAYDIKTLKEELIFMEENLKNRSDLVFCHNDLLLNNFIKNEKTIELIDYEYSGYSYRAFDIANHFNEWCGFDLKWENFPNEDTQRRFLKIYFEAYYDNKKNESNLEKEIDKTIEDIKWFDLASNYFWGMWALIQAALSTIDFNYCDYGRQRFKRYFELKKKLLENNSKQ